MKYTTKRSAPVWAVLALALVMLPACAAAAIDEAATVENSTTAFEGDLKATLIERSSSMPPAEGHDVPFSAGARFVTLRIRDRLKKMMLVVYTVARKASSGNVPVELRYGQQIFSTDAPTLEITRDGIARSYPRITLDGGGSYGEVDGPLFVDLDGSGERDLVFTELERGANCCISTLVYRYDGGGALLSTLRSRLGKLQKSTASNPNGTSQPCPIRSQRSLLQRSRWSRYRAQRERLFVNVTRAHPQRVRRDAAYRLSRIRESKDRSSEKRAYCTESDTDGFRMFHQALHDGGYAPA